MPERRSKASRARTHRDTSSRGDALRRAVAATKCGVPRYTRELVASLRDARTIAAGVSIDSVDESHPMLEQFGEDASAIDAISIGHATVLLRLGGMTILTDPVFSDRIGMRVMGRTLGLRRIRPAAVLVNQLPRIDVVLLSHAHFDHLDRPSLELLAAGPARGAAVVTATGTRRLIPRGFSQVIELGWARRAVLGVGADHELGITAMRPTHWGARAVADRHRGFNAYLLETSARRVFFAGDTALTDAFSRIGATDLSIFGIGAYDPWEHAHATPEQVWKMYTGMSSGRPAGALLPMHHSTFVLGREPMDEPLRRLLAAAGPRHDLIVAQMPGDGVRV